jgi:hypothetical protein
MPSQIIFKTQKKTYVILRRHFRSFFEAWEAEDNFISILYGKLKAKRAFELKGIKILIASKTILWLSVHHVVRIPLSHLNLERMIEQLSNYEKIVDEKIPNPQGEFGCAGSAMFSVIADIWLDALSQMPGEVIEYKPQSNVHFKPKIKKQFRYKRDIPAYRFHLRSRFNRNR